MTPTETLLTLDEYFDLPDQPGVVHEMLHGRLLEIAKPRFERKEIAGNWLHLLKLLCQKQFPEFRISGDTEFILNAETVQAPDALLARSGRGNRLPE
ncbi:MAG: hypothetical protein FJW31_03920 [Acidobacteria bacterium]|nr:hypothetical protein [Acidobacteriota bacterium]